MRSQVGDAWLEQPRFLLPLVFNLINNQIFMNWHFFLSSLLLCLLLIRLTGWARSIPRSPNILLPPGDAAVNQIPIQENKPIINLTQFKTSLLLAQCSGIKCKETTHDSNSAQQVSVCFNISVGRNWSWQRTRGQSTRVTRVLLFRIWV